MFFGRFLIAFNCLLYIGLALWALASPLTLLSALEVSGSSRAALIELQVLIAGSFVGFCLLIVGGLFDQKKTKRSLIGLFLINASWLFTRCIALLEGLPEGEHNLSLHGLRVVDPYTRPDCSPISNRPERAHLVSARRSELLISIQPLSRLYAR